MSKDLMSSGMPRPAQREYVIVQSLTQGPDLLARQDGAHGEYPTGTLLPWAKASGLKLKKGYEDADSREFTFVLTREQEGTTVLPGEHGGTFAPPLPTPQP